MADKSLRQKARAKKPAKPHPDFPLTPHASGQWCKKIKGRMYYFGKDADEALRQYNAIKDNLLEGIDPRTVKPGETLGWLCNAFLDSREAKRKAGELSQRTFDDYKATCKRLAKYFGKTRRLDSLGPLDFGPYKAKLQENWNHVTTNNEIGRVRVVLNYGYEIDAIDRPIKTGPGFKKASKKTLKLERRKKPKKLFTATQIQELVAAADEQLRAMILLGINAGYGNADCGRLETSWIDFDQSWLNEVRGKTAVDRHAWLWPETITALRDVIANRPEPKDASFADRVFITKYGNPWHRDEQRHTPIASSFAKLTKAYGERRWNVGPFCRHSQPTGCYQHHVSFYALRHTFETIAGNSRDQVAVDCVMGHVDDSMAAEYREDIDPQRIIDVCSFVRSWLYGGAK